MPRGRADAARTRGCCALLFVEQSVSFAVIIFGNVCKVLYRIDFFLCVMNSF
jgi:hypothetical protein